MIYWCSLHESEGDPVPHPLHNIPRCYTWWSHDNLVMDDCVMDWRKA